MQLDNLVDFEKCCKTRIFLQKSMPIQPKTSEILPKFAKNWQLPYGSAGRLVRGEDPRPGRDAAPLAPASACLTSPCGLCLLAFARLIRKATLLTMS